MKDVLLPRRSLMSRLTALGAFVALGSKEALAQAPASGFQPARHAEDAWMDRMLGKHRVFVDSAYPAGALDAIGFANNVFIGNQSGYGLGDSDVAVIVCLRHQSAAFAFTDVVWSKHGKALADSVSYKDPKTGEAPLANPYLSAPRGGLQGLAKRGVHFAVCNLSTRRLSRLLAGSEAEAEAMYKHLVSNALPNAHFVPAGVVAVTRAQELGFSFLFAG